jgi:hypothetical protein
VIVRHKTAVVVQGQDPTGIRNTTEASEESGRGEGLRFTDRGVAERRERSAMARSTRSRATDSRKDGAGTEGQ